MLSPTSNGACFHALAWFADAVAGFSVTQCVQYTWPAGGGASSPETGSGTPACVKLRQPMLVRSLTLGRFFCGHSGSSVTPGFVRGTHIG